MTPKNRTMVYLATAETRHFTFSAIGTTSKQARALCHLAWLAHAEQYDCDPDHVPLDDIGVRIYQHGSGYRDDWAIVTEE